MSYNGQTNNTIGLEQFLKYFLPESKARLRSEYRIIVFDSYTSYISSEVIRAYITNKIILLYLSLYTTYLLQPLDIRLFIPLSIYYKNDIRENTKFGYNYSINKLVFLELYYQARDLAFTIENIQKAWKKSGLELFCPLVAMGTFELVLLPNLLSPTIPTNSESRLTTLGRLIPNSYIKTLAYIGDIRQILEL